MNKESLDLKIRALKSVKRPLPGSLEANVLRRVRNYQAEENQETWDWIAMLIPRSSFVALALSVVVAVSFFATLTYSKAYANEASRQVLLNEALGFDSIVKHTFTTSIADR